MTTWEDRRRIEDDLMQGKKPSEQECMALVKQADAGELFEQQMDAFKAALESVGLTVIDVTTDDDGGATVLEIVPIDDDT